MLSSRILLHMFGSHLSVAGGLHNALLAAQSYGMGTVQIFTASPRTFGGIQSAKIQHSTKNQQQWVAMPLEPAAIQTFREHAQKAGYTKIVAHDSYLINLAAADDTLRQKSIAAFAHEMERCDQLDIPYLVTHPGAHVGQGEECGIGKVIEAFNEIAARQSKGKVTVCIETTAGQGTCLGCTFEHIATMLRAMKYPERFGVCIDTAHILAAGYDITTAEGTKKVLADFDRIVGLKHVKVFHLNDSKKALGTRVDRHEHIGRGFVGLPAFQVICSDARLKDIPKILETPKEGGIGDRTWDELNLEILEAFAAGKTCEQVQKMMPKLEVVEEAPKAKSAKPKKAAKK